MTVACNAFFFFSLSPSVVFMGSEKYPGENAFDTFIAKHGGYGNACTGCEKVWPLVTINMFTRMLMTGNTGSPCRRYLSSASTSHTSGKPWTGWWACVGSAWYF